MAKTTKRKKTPRSSIPIPKIDAVPVPKRRRSRRPAAARPPTELPEPLATYEI